MDPNVSPEFLAPFPVTEPAIGYINDLFVGQTAQIKAANQDTPSAITNALIPKITHLYVCLRYKAMNVGIKYIANKIKLILKIPFSIFF